MAAGLPIKYQLRAYNILRDLARVQASCPELLVKSAEPSRILDQSSGGCGLWECLTPLGHDVNCFDFFPKQRPREFGNAYAHIHELLKVDVQHFDGRRRPFPLASGSRDYVFCFQAVDAYAPAGKWSEPVTELLRVASKAVVIVLNPPSKSDDFEVSASKLLAGMRLGGFGVREFQCPDTKLPGNRFDKTD